MNGEPRQRETKLGWPLKGLTDLEDYGLNMVT